MAGGPRGHATPDFGGPGPAQALRRLLLGLPRRQQEPQPALVHHGGVRHGREEAPLRSETGGRARSRTAWRLSGSPRLSKRGGAGTESGPASFSIIGVDPKQRADYLKRRALRGPLPAPRAWR